MKTQNKQRWWLAALLAISCSALFSFSSPAGGDVVEIYLNDNLLVRQYLYNDKEIKTVSLQNAKAGDQLRVYYGHCGTNGRSRSITLKDGQDKELKKWQFADVSGSAKAMMNFGVKDILGFQKNGNGKFRLYYTSREIPDGKLLAGISTVKDNKANP